MIFPTTNVHVHIILPHGKKLWRLLINSPKFYPPIYCFTLISFCTNTQFTNVFTAIHVLGTYQFAKVIVRYDSIYVLLFNSQMPEN